jgi:hypothetical protein
MSTNMNPVTGIRYGIIAANSLDPEIIDKIQSRGKDLYIESASNELEAAIRAACDDYLSKSSCDDLVDHAQDLLCNGFRCDEPIHSFDIDGVKGQTTWLGGALMVWVFESPFQETCDLCSPCVPGCGNLDSRNPDGYQCYDVPNDWRYENDQHRNNQEPA